MKLLSHVANLPQIEGESSVLPSSFSELLKELCLKPDSTGLKLMKDISLPECHDPVTPVIFRVNQPYKLQSFRLSWSAEGGGFVMSRGQAAAYLRSEILSLRTTGPCTIWIPFADGEGDDSFAQFIIRIYRRADSSTEVFFYALDDESEWDHRGDYFVALGKYGQ